MQSSDQHASQEPLDHYIIRDDMQTHLTPVINYNHCSTEQQIAANLLLNYSNQNYANINTTHDGLVHLTSDVVTTAPTTRVTPVICTNNQSNKNNNSQHKLPNILQRQRVFSDLDVHNYALNGTNSHNHHNRQDDTSAPLFSNHLQSANLEPTYNELTSSPVKSLKFVAVHLGAGSYCASNHEELKRLAKEVCENVMRLSRDSRHHESTTSAPSTKRNTQSGRSHRNYKNNPSKKIQLQTKESVSGNMDAVTAAAQLIKQLEDHHLLNCGYGSNLNMKGHVECDASLMSDRPLQIWTGIGALSGCKNPILLAKHLYDQQTIQRPLHLVQPNLLVGQGAKQWMREHSPQLVVADSQLISPKSLKVYSKLKSQYDETVRNKKSHSVPDINSPHITVTDDANSSNINEVQSNFQNPSTIPVEAEIGHSSDDIDSTTFYENSQMLMHPSEFDHGFYCRRSSEQNSLVKPKIEADLKILNRQNSELDNPYLPHKTVAFDQRKANELSWRLDTVGAVVIDCDNNIASAISSGGILLKCNGRVGQAAIPGAGCWAQKSIGVTTSGVGEYLTVTLFAKKIQERLNAIRSKCVNEQLTTTVINQELTKCFEEELLESLSLTHIDMESKQAGFLAVMQTNPEIGPNQLLLSYGHNTSSMCIGYMSADDIEGHSKFNTITSGNPKKPGQAHIETFKIAI